MRLSNIIGVVALVIGATFAPMAQATIKVNNLHFDPKPADAGQCKGKKCAAGGGY